MSFIQQAIYGISVVVVYLLFPSALTLGWVSEKMTDEITASLSLSVWKGLFINATSIIIIHMMPLPP